MLATVDEAFTFKDGLLGVLVQMYDRLGKRRAPYIADMKDSGES